MSCEVMELDKYANADKTMAIEKQEKGFPTNLQETTDDKDPAGIYPTNAHIPCSVSLSPGNIPTAIPDAPKWRKELQMPFA